MKNKIFSVIVTLSLLLSFSACSNDDNNLSKEAESNVAVLMDNIKNGSNKEDGYRKEKTNSKDKKNKNKKSQKQSIRLKFFGDIMAHMGQVNHAYYYGGQNYDFSSQFEYIDDFVKDSDLSFGNFETSINPDLDPSGYPRFTTPVEYIRDIKNAGFDVLSTANNHSADSGEKGIFDTINYMDKEDMAHAGTRVKDGKRFIYQNVKGLKLAFLSYTYGINGLEGVIEENKPEDLINFLDPEEIQRDIKKVKEDGADFVVVYPHWGNEYESYPSQYQITLGRNMVDWGADLVIGNHPHVVQPAEHYKSKDGRDGYIAYSCGNFVSMQSLESLGDIRCEHSVAFDIKLTKDNEKTIIDSVEFYPIWVGHGSDEYGSFAKVYRTVDFLEDGKYYDYVDEYQRDRIRQADQMVTETINTKVK